MTSVIARTLNRQMKELPQKIDIAKWTQNLMQKFVRFAKELTFLPEKQQALVILLVKVLMELKLIADLLLTVLSQVRMHPRLLTTKPHLII